MALAFHIIPHTHWDREWYLPQATFQTRLIPVLDDVLNQLETHPAARFLLDGQTILLEDYLEVRPEAAERIAAQVKRGALEIGPWYVLSDLLIPTADSLRENLRMGQRMASRFGRCLDVLYSPDAFGHPAALPDIAAEFGLRRAVIRRGLGKPRDFYRWIGPGGGELLVHHLPPGGYDYAIDLATAHADLESLWPPLRSLLMARAETDQIAVFLGADHHGMAGDVIGLRDRLQRIESTATVTISGLSEYFDAVEAEPTELTTVRGELRHGGGHTWVLPDVLSARSRLKRHHTRAEWELSRVAEPLARLAAQAGGRIPRGELTQAWRLLLQSQFHDTLAGTTSDEVQREQAVRLSRVEAIATTLAEQSLHELIGHDPDLARDYPERTAPALVLWNPTEFPCGGIMTATATWFTEDVLVGPPDGRVPRSGPGYQPFVLVGSDGAVIPIQVLSLSHDQERLDSSRHYPDQDRVDRVQFAFVAPALAPWGLAILKPRVQPASPPDGGLRVADGHLTNDVLSVRISDCGVVSIQDLQSGELYQNLLHLRDERDDGDLYTYSAGPNVLNMECRPLSQMIIANGPLIGAIETVWSMPSQTSGGMHFRSVVTLSADSPVVRVSLEITNQAGSHRLRAVVPTECLGATAGATIGLEHRQPVAPSDQPIAIEREVATAPAQRIVASASGNRGLALVSPGCFEYEATPNGELILTLLRAVGELARAELPERPGLAAWPMATPLGQELGAHRVELALVPVTERELRNASEVEQLVARALLPTIAHFVRTYINTRGHGHRG